MANRAHPKMCLLCYRDQEKRNGTEPAPKGRSLWVPLQVTPEGNQSYHQKRNKELESTLNYNEKPWTENIDMVNQNTIKMYQA